MKEIAHTVGLLSITTTVSGLRAMPEAMERTRSTGLWSCESFQKATSLIWAMEQSMPRVDSWFSLEHTVTRHPRPGIMRTLVIRS